MELAGCLARLREAQCKVDGHQITGVPALVVLKNLDLIDELEVAFFLRFPFGHLLSALLAAVFASFRGRAAGNPRAPPSTRRFAALRQVTQTDTAGSVVVGLAVRRMERLAIRRYHRPGRNRHRLAPERLSPVLGLEGPPRKPGVADRT
jgi:hypothetical protein